MSKLQKIAVIGATGMLGRPVVTALLDAGFDVTAVVRDAGRAARMLPPAVRLIEADVFDEESLRCAFAGQDGVYLNLSVAPGARPSDMHTEAQGLPCASVCMSLGLAHILSAAKAAGIARVGYMSAMIQDARRGTWWVRDVWQQAIARIKNSGIPYTIFYASNVMETIPERHRWRDLLVIARTGHVCHYWIAGADLGRQVARAFALEDAANREYVMQGPEAMSYVEAAERYARSYPSPLRVVKVPLALVRALGAVSAAMRFNARILAEVLAYPEEFKAQTAWDELGRPTITIEDLASGAAPGSLVDDAPAPQVG
jgi:uncharacterized protein YbjT (DUF2867 family)